MQYFYHGSQAADILELLPFESNHGVPRVYLSSKRENVLVYLSNAVEKYCKETSFSYNGIWYKWASYGFDKQGRLQFEEYYPNALYDTYKGVSGYIYAVKSNDAIEPLQGIADAYISTCSMPVESCEYIPDAYDAIIEAEQQKLISVVRYGQLSDKMLKWLKYITIKEYNSSEHHPEYRHFLKGKFPELFE